MPPPRPLLHAAAALAAGALAADLAEPLTLGLAAVGVIGALRQAARREPGTLVLLLALVAAARASLADVEPRPGAARAADPAAAAQPRTGAWTGAGGDRGFLVADGAAPLPWLLDPSDGPPPAEGERVTALPDGETLAWPRGPAPGPRARAGRFAGLLPLEVDGLVRRAPPAGRGRPSERLARRVGACTEALRACVGRRLARDPERSRDHRVAGFGRALLLGERDDLDPALVDLFTRTGTRHLLAVSGLHVALFAALVLAPFIALARARGLRPGGATAARTVLLLAYAPLAGGGPPVVRATLALVLGWLAPRGRRPDALSAWSLALVLELLADPRAVHDASVSLSYLATLGLLVGVAPVLRGRGLGARGRPRLAPRPLVLAWPAAVVRRLARAAALGAAASAVASLATLPVVWARFGEFGVAGVAATPAVLPPFALALVLLWAQVLLPGPLARPAGAAAEQVLELVVRMLAVADTLPGTPWLLPERPALLVALACGAALVALARGPGAARVGRLAALAGALVLVPWTPTPRGLEVHLLDVGHGTCALVRAPGLPALVYDAGSRDRPHVAGEALRPLLARWEVGGASRPVVVLSHDHRDHGSALGWLAGRAPPRVWMGALPARLGERLPHDCVRIDTRPGALELAPRTPGAPGRGPGDPRLRLVRGADGSGNEASRWLEVAWGGVRVLLGGDAEAEGLDRVLAAGLLEGPVDVLLWPHHGSDTPLLAPLLASTAPRRVWLSAAATPPAVVPELDRRGVPWCSTRGGPLTALFLPPRPGQRDSGGDSARAPAGGPAAAPPR